MLVYKLFSTFLNSEMIFNITSKYIISYEELLKKSRLNKIILKITIVIGILEKLWSLNSTFIFKAVYYIS